MRQSCSRGSAAANAPAPAVASLTNQMSCRGSATVTVTHDRRTTDQHRGPTAGGANVILMARGLSPDTGPAWASILMVLFATEGRPRPHLLGEPCAKLSWTPAGVNRCRSPRLAMTFVIDENANANGRPLWVESAGHGRLHLRQSDGEERVGPTARVTAGRGPVRKGRGRRGTRAHRPSRKAPRG